MKNRVYSTTGPSLVEKPSNKIKVTSQLTPLYLVSALFITQKRDISPHGFVWSFDVISAI